MQQFFAIISCLFTISLFSAEPTSTNTKKYTIVYKYSGECSFFFDSLLLENRVLLNRPSDFGDTFTVKIVRNRFLLRNRQKNCFAVLRFKNSDVLYEEYYDNEGDKILRFDFIGDSIVRQRKFYKSSFPLLDYSFKTKNNRRIPISISRFYDNGELKTNADFFNGSLMSFKNYWRDGSLAINSFLLKGTGWVFCYNDKGQLENALYFENFDLTRIEFYANSKLFMLKEGEFKFNLDFEVLKYNIFNVDEILQQNGTIKVYDLNNGEVLHERIL